VLVTPQTPEELAEALCGAARGGSAIALGGRFSQGIFGGPAVEATATISTAGLARLRTYDPRDLTISVEAGMPFAELTRLLAQNRQMIPLDPPFLDQASVGGVLGVNSAGPRRRLYGTARDMVIGMTFATLDGKLVESGGMVVKNVAGLDTAKLMIGSFGTLAAIAIVNFKVAPMPPRSCLYAASYASLAEAVAARDAVMQSVLQPAVVDLLNPAAAQTAGLEGWVLLVDAGGGDQVLARYRRELPAAAEFEGEAREAVLSAVREFTPRALAQHPTGVLVRVSCLVSQVAEVVASIEGPVAARAANGIVYGAFPGAAEAVKWMGNAAQRGWKVVVESAGEDAKRAIELWPCPGGDFETMRRIEALFDPANLLNRGRLYGRI
jgi:glycolate oxidase FAD binding subunit